VEGIKESSRQLRGTIADELARDSDHFVEQDKQLLKFHGSYQQEDRDARKLRRKDGVGKHYMFMVRCKIPGGRLTAAQYLAVDDLAGAYGNGTLRFTTRQGIQLHGVLKSYLKDTIAGINQCLLTTLGACGDVERNVMACPAPHYQDGVHAQLQETAKTIAANLAPRSRAYHEIWLNGKPLGPRSQASGVRSQEADRLTPDSWLLTPDDEPLYGKVYLPRKFKTGLALPEDNCIDVHAQDLGLLALVENGEIVGYNVLVGGGMGMTHGNANTFPYLARPICYVPARAIVGTAEAVVKLFRDHGNRADRKRARIKYVVHDWGVERFRDVLGEYVGGTLQLPRPVEVRGYDPHLGWHPQGDGRWYYGLSIENGRVKDEAALRLRTGLRTIIKEFQPGLRITPLQDLLLCDLEAGARPEVDRLLSGFGITRSEHVSRVQSLSMACPAVPTCGLAIAESERVLPGVIDGLEAELKRLGLEDEKLSVRMTGCPNGCARPYQSDIGLVGRSGDKYSVFVGGTVLGNRLNFLLRDLVPMAAIVPLLVPLLEQFRQERQPGEGFGDWCQRLGVEQVQALLPADTGERRGVSPPCGERRGVGSPWNSQESGEGMNGHAKPAGAKPDKTDGEVVSVPITNRIRGNGHQAAPTAALPPTAEAGKAEPALAEPDARVVPLGLPEPAALGAGLPTLALGAGLPTPPKPPPLGAGLPTPPKPPTAGLPLATGLSERQPTPPPAKTTMPPKQSETFLAGPPGEELRDYTYRYNTDGSVRDTAVYFYGDDLRAAGARLGDALRREAVYQGKVDASRLYGARKLSDTHYAGAVGHERRDYRLEYRADGQVGQTVVFYYDGDARAADAPSGAPVRRQVAYEGALPG
jgi:sulfite reductase (ferredoxin)